VAEIDDGNTEEPPPVPELTLEVGKAPAMAAEDK